MLKNDAIIDSVQCLLTGCFQPGLREKDLGSLRYLLGQSIRQYDISPNNCHITQAAKERWDEISNDNIKKYQYRDVVVCNNLQVPTPFKLFIGANGRGNPTTLRSGSTFVFRQMFHEDHVIPVSLILNEMITKRIVDRQEIKNLLDMMHLCILLKEEDRIIGRTKGRTIDYWANVKNVYNPNGILII